MKQTLARLFLAASTGKDSLDVAKVDGPVTDSVVGEALDSMGTMAVPPTEL